MTSERKGLSWGIGIWLLYGGFVLFILACVGFASMQHFDMVEDQYYERGISYQQHIDTESRTQASGLQPRFRYDTAARELCVDFPDSLQSERITGTLLLYRPSNSQHDTSITFEVSQTRSTNLSMREKPTGLWRAKLNWQYDDQSYYNDFAFVIDKERP